MQERLLFDLIKYELFNCEIPQYDKDKIDEEILMSLYKISKRHDIAHIISDALYRNGLLKNNSPIYASFIKEQQISILRYEQINHELFVICKILEENKIPFVPLKGSVLRDYYPEPWLRTSCDIDILIRESDVKFVSDLLVKKYEYQLTCKTEHDISFITIGNVHLELHYNLIEGNKTETVLKTVWDNVELKKNYKYHYLMTDEMYYFYHIAHMAKHFGYGGCGIRPFIDLFIMQNKLSINKEKFCRMLKQADLEKFYVVSMELSNMWFGNGQCGELCQRMHKFIFNSGVYGDTKKRIAIEQGKKGGKCEYVLSRIFLPYNKLEIIYPIISKHKILTPFCEVHRWFKIIFSRRAKSALKEIEISANMDKSLSESTNKLLQDLNLE